MAASPATLLTIREAAKRLALRSTDHAAPTVHEIKVLAEMIEDLAVHVARLVEAHGT